MSQHRSPEAEAFDDLVVAPSGVSALRRALTHATLRRQDRRAAALGHRHTALGLLMAAERLDDVIEPAARPDASAAERLALAALWATLYRVGRGGPDRGTPHWNPGSAHLRQVRDVRRWSANAPAGEVQALLRQARRVAAAEFLAARGRSPGGRKSAVCPI